MNVWAQRVLCDAVGFVQETDNISCVEYLMETISGPFPAGERLVMYHSQLGTQVMNRQPCGYIFLMLIYVVIYLLMMKVLTCWSLSVIRCKIFV